MNDDDDIVYQPIDGELDLHTFKPSECKSLVPEYLHACREKGILEVRIIHGKGRGVLRQTVQSILKRESCVSVFYQATQDAGDWGATMVILKPISA